MMLLVANMHGPVVAWSAVALLTGYVIVIFGVAAAYARRHH